MRTLPLSKVYQLIEPGPVVLLSTTRNGKPNIMPMSWHMMVEFEPPLAACIVSDANFSFHALNETGECVIAVPPVRIAQKVVQAGNCHGDAVDKFAAIGFTAVPARKIQCSLIAECFANLECKVVDRKLVSSYDLFILEVKKAWFDPDRINSKTVHHRGYGKFAIDGRIVSLPSKMR